MFWTSQIRLCSRCKCSAPLRNEIGGFRVRHLSVIRGYGVPRKKRRTRNFRSFAPAKCGIPVMRPDEFEFPLYPLLLILLAETFNDFGIVTGDDKQNSRSNDN